MFSPFFNNSFNTQNSSDNLVGVDALTVLNYYQSMPASGLLGNPSTGNFHISCLFKVDSQDVASATRVFLSCAPVGGGNFGWRFRTTTTNSAISFTAYNSVGTAVVSPSYTIPASMVGETIHAVGVIDGSFIRLYINGTEVGSGTVMTSYNYPINGVVRVGREVISVTGAEGSVIVYGVEGGNSVPTTTEINDACLQSKFQGDIAPIKNKTNNLISVRKSLSGSLTDINSPNTLLDSVGTGSLSKVGLPIITYSNMNKIVGYDGIDDSNYWQMLVTSGTAIRGTSGVGCFWINSLFAMDDSNASFNDRYIVNFGLTGSSGYYMKLTGSTASVQIEFGVADNSGNTVRAARYALSQQNQNKFYNVVGVYDNTVTPNRIRMYVNGIQNSTGAVITTGYTQPTNNHRLGRYSGVDGLSLSGTVRLYGYQGGNNVPTDSEILNNYLDTVKTVTVQPIPGKSDHLFTHNPPNDALTDKIVAESNPVRFGSLSVYNDFGANINK